MLDTALKTALHDPSLFTRSEVYGALANLLTYHQQTDPEIVQRVLTTLIAALLREAESELQDTAYDAIHTILNGNSPPYSNKIFNRDTDVDWAPLEPYREAAEQMDFTPAQF